MAATFKREPKRFNSSTANFSEHLNQLGFKGIVHKNNLFEVDPLSLKDAKNVYLNDDSILISRDPIVVENLPDGYRWADNNLVASPIVARGYTLVDMVDTVDATIYVTYDSVTKLYKIVARHNIDQVLMDLPELVNQYHISVIERYIIVFNNVDAVVINVDNFNDGWKFLKEEADIPVTKRVVGQEVFEQPFNQFTGSYKEDYIWGEDIISLLPEGTAKVIVNQTPKNITWTLPDANINTEFRVIRTINAPMRVSDIVSVATNANTGISVLCIARDTHVLISLNEGLSFEKVMYPINDGTLDIASVSKDGLCFFFVAQDGVYRYTIGSKSWEAIRITTPGAEPNLKGVGLHNTCYFENAEVFTFVLYDSDLETPIANIYWKGPGLGSNQFDTGTLGYTLVHQQVDPTTQLNMTRQDCASDSLHIVQHNGHTCIAAWLPGVSSDTTRFIIIIGQGESEHLLYSQALDRAYGKIESMKVTDTDNFRGVNIRGLTVDNGTWYSADAKLGVEIIETISTSVADFNLLVDTEVPVTNTEAPIDLGTAYLAGINTYSVDGIVKLPTELNGVQWPGTAPRRSTICIGQYFYTFIGDHLYTNKMLTTSNATIEYTRIVDTPYTQIPNVSHVNNELYLGFGDTLKITANERDGTIIKFNLPKINDHAFTSSINGIINISSIEVAIFLINQIYLVNQVPDDLLGYRYDYFNTRLSTGVRRDDSIVNTKDGMYTLYPTVQGLAVMNYQSDVATTDQIVDYVTKDITDIWATFYKASNNIKIVQMRDYVFLTNGTVNYIMLDLRGMTWWYFESPVPVIKMVTDQFNLKIISNGLYKFDTEYKGYKDLYVKFIDWRLESQPLHFNAPSHYKNMKQIIYQFEESTNISQTIASQIKLYRKQITYREPELINFKVDGYRTFVKRFNYWKINELQWTLAADSQNELEWSSENPAPTQSQLRLIGLTIKYERGEEVRS